MLIKFSLISDNLAWEEEEWGPSSESLKIKCKISILCVEWRVVDYLVREECQLYLPLIVHPYPNRARLRDKWNKYADVCN